ncbi:MAG: DUF2066 domain-containing protein [Pseudomonadota bacterium]
MRRLAEAIRLTLAAGLVALTSAGAALADPFTIARVPVDESAGNATQAQRQALTTAQTLAADRLLQRLTLPEDRLDGRLPTITPEEAAELVSGIQIANEQRSATRYIANVTVSFDRRAVQDFLNRFDVPFVEAQSGRTLVVAVSDDETGQVTLQSEWAEAWINGGFQYALTPMIGFGARQGADGQPLGAEILSARAALNGDVDALQAVAALYNADRVLVVGARAGADGAAAASGRVYARDGAEWLVQPIPGVVSNEGFAGAAELIVAREEELWKREVIVRGGEERELAITALFQGHSQWRLMQGALTQASLVSDARLDGLSSTGAAMTLRHRGSLDQLGAELRARGLILEQVEPLGWTVRQP